MTERVRADQSARLEIAAQLRVVMYLRVSKPGDKSINDQEKVGRRDIAEQGGVVVAVFKDKLSASRYRRVQDRPDFIAMKEFVRAGKADLLWTFAHNRSHRDLDDYVPLRRLCIDSKTMWRYGGKTYDLTKSSDRHAATADAVRAEEQGDDISEAINRGVQEALEDGKPHGKLPRGYKIIRDENTGKAINREPIPAQARVIRRAAEMLLDPDAPQSLGAVARLLAPEWASAGGKGTWEHRTVRALLINPTYAGLRTYEGEVAREGTWEGILTLEQHQRLRALLMDPKRTTHRGSAPEHWLSYIAVCGVCKGPITGKSPLSTRPRGAPTYRCHAGHASRPRALVDAYVEELLMQLLEDPGVLARLTARDEQDGGASVDAELAKIQGLRADIATYVRDAAKTRMSAASVATYVESLEAEIVEAQRRVDAMTAPVNTVLVDVVGADVRRRWGSYSLMQRREIVRATMTVTIIPNKRRQRNELGVVVRPIGALAG